jgi:site-specific DNA-methyltransferase (adenine-specific)
MIDRITEAQITTESPAFAKPLLAEVPFSEAYLLDCIELMSRYEDGYFDLAVCDPPYGIGMDNQKKRTKPNRPNSYTHYKDIKYNISNWDNNTPTKEYFTELFRVSKNQIIWGANYFCEYLPSGKGWIYWDKQMGDNSFSSGEFAYQSMFVKSFSFSYPSDRGQNRIHPTEKPIQLYDWIFSKFTKEGMKVLDTHLGSQNSRLSAHKYNLNFVGCEIDEIYFKNGNKRYADFTSQTRLW